MIGVFWVKGQLLPLLLVLRASSAAAVTLCLALCSHDTPFLPLCVLNTVSREQLQWLADKSYAVLRLGAPLVNTVLQLILIS